MANNAMDVNTGYTPFCLIQGSHSSIPSTPLCGDLAKASNQVAAKALGQIKMVLRDTPSNLSIAQQCMKCVVNQKRWAKEWKFNDEVVLYIENLRACCLHALQKIKHSK